MEGKTRAGWDMEEMSSWLRDVEKVWTLYVQIITNKQKKRNRRSVRNS
jgi:hypothetical protein